jgi:hypothetical protein
VRPSGAMEIRTFTTLLASPHLHPHPHPACRAAKSELVAPNLFTRTVCIISMKPPPPALVAAAWASGALLLAWAALRSRSGHGQGSPASLTPKSSQRGRERRVSIAEEPEDIRPSTERRVSFSEDQPAEIPPLEDSSTAADTPGVNAGHEGPVPSFVDAGRAPSGGSAQRAGEAQERAEEVAEEAQNGGEEGGEEEYEVWSKEKEDSFTSVGGRGARPPRPEHPPTRLAPPRQRAP